MSRIVDHVQAGRSGRRGRAGRSKWVLALAVSAALAGTASAGTPYFWDGGTADLAGNGDGVSQGGTGTWNTTTKNWDPGAGSPYVAWPNTTAFDAVFAGTAGTVTLGTPITAGNVSLGGATGYTLATGSNALTTNAGFTIPATGFLQTLSSNAGAGGLALTGGAGGSQTFNLSAGSTLAINGLLSGSDTITNTAAGRISLISTGNTFTGKYVLNAGVLALTADSSLGPVPGAAVADYITLNGGLLQDGIGNTSPATGTFGQSATFTLNANRGITLGTGSNSIQVGYGATIVMTIAGKITGAGGFTKPDGGTLQLTNGANDYAGTTNITGGVLAVTANGALGTAAGGTTVGGGTTLDLQNVAYTTAETLTINGATLSASTGTSTFAGDIAAAANSNTISVAGTALTLSGNLNGAAGGSYNKTGAGTLTISGTVDNNGGRIKVAAGTVVLAKTSSGGAHAVGSNGNTDFALVVNGGTAQLGGTGGDQIYVNSAVQMTGGTFDLNALSEGFDGLAGTGGTVLNNNNAAVSILTLGQNNSAGSPTFSGTIANGTGVLALAKVGTGSQTLAAANTYTGGTTLTAGTLIVGLTNALPSSGTVTFTGGTLDSNAKADSMGPLSISSGASTLKLGAAADTGNVVTFASASLASGTLAVTNWDGSLAGGGGDRFLVTANPSAATLAAITFVNPAGLPAGTYAAKVVGSGPFEIVPVPEPAAVGLLALTGLGALARRRRSRRA